MADPNHVVLHQERLVVLLPCKCAQTTLKDALGRVCGVDPGLLLYTSLSEIPQGYEVIGAIREPLRRAYSGWRHMYSTWSADTFVEHVCQYDDGLLDQHVRSQVSDLTYENQPAASRWLIVERLAKDWATLCRDRKWPETPLKVLNAGPSDVPWWSPRQERRLRERFAQDARLYAYAVRSGTW